MEKLNQFTGIKAYAFLCVFMWHMVSFLPISIPKTGNIGVEVFLVVSGYLVALNYYNSSRLDNMKAGGKYALKKIRALFPLHIIMFIPSLIFYLHNFLSEGRVAFGFFNAAVNFLLLQSWIPNQQVYFSFNGVEWYLSSVLFCYAFTPLLFKFSKKCKNNILPIIVCFVFKAIIEITSNHYLGEELNTWLIYVCPLTRMLDYFCGIELYCFSCNKSSNIKDTGLFQLVVLLLCGLYIVFFGTKEWYTLVDFVSFVMVAVLIKPSKLSKVLLENKIIQYIGGYSTELYLIHLPVKLCWVVMSGKAKLQFHYGINICVIFLFSMLISVLWRIVMNKYKQKHLMR